MATFGRFWFGGTGNDSAGAKKKPSINPSIHPSILFSQRLEGGSFGTRPLSWLLITCSFEMVFFF